MQTAEQKVSVIIPVYNVEKYLAQALDSILDQDYPELEIILVENMSEDGSMKICQSYEKAHKEIRLFREKKKGPGAARNTGVKKADGTYIMFIDADDYLPDKKIITKFVNIAEQTASDVVICNYARLWNEKLLPAAEHRAFSELNPDTEDFRFKGFFSIGNLSYVWGRIYRKAFLNKNGLQFHAVEYSEDKLYNIQCYMCGARYAFLSDIGYIYRKNEQSVSYQYRSDSMKCWLEMIQILQRGEKKIRASDKMDRNVICYIIFFATFFDAKMEYVTKRKSMRAVRKCLRNYGTHPLTSECFKELTDRRKTGTLSQWLWRWMLWGFSFGMQHHLYGLLTFGIKVLIDLRIDERLSDTGLRE
mgnify:FL=1